MQLKSFMKKYCPSDSAPGSRDLMGELLGVTPITVWRWLTKGTINVIHKDGVPTEITETVTRWKKEDR